VQKNGKICVPTSLQEIETRVGSDRSVAVLRHLLTYTDGAVILDAQARAIGVGALKYSEASKRLMRHVPEPDIPQLNDSPRFCQRNYICRFERWSVTVFSDGMSVTDLEVRFADETPTKSPEESFTPE